MLNHIGLTNIETLSYELCSATYRRKTQFVVVNQREWFNFPGFFPANEQLILPMKLKLSLVRIEFKLLICLILLVENYKLVVFHTPKASFQ